MTAFTFNDYRVTIDEAGPTLTGRHIVTIRPYGLMAGCILAALTGNDPRAQRAVLRDGLYALETMAEAEHVQKLAEYCREALGESRVADNVVEQAKAGENETAWLGPGGL